MGGGDGFFVEVLYIEGKFFLLLCGEYVCVE